MDYKDFLTVREVASSYLCCSCGACGAVCPVEAIDYRETPGGYLFPVIDVERCTLCGLCLRSCPGVNLTGDPESVLPEDPFTGPILTCSVGKAADKGVYEGSQSGGALSALILSLLRKERIAGATSVVLEKGAPPRPLLKIVRDRDGIIDAQGSKYCPAPVLSLIQQIKREKGPVAFVGLGCHVHGLRNIARLFPELHRKLGPVIGLVCDRILTYGAIDYLIRRGKVKEGEAVAFQYRSKEQNGYPGDVRIGPEGSAPVFLHRKERIKIKDFYTPARCRLCFDKMNVLSDLTFGDPHGMSGIDRTGGESLVLVRTEVGRDALDSAVEGGELVLREASIDSALDGQGMEGKRRDFAGYCRQWLSLERPLPAQALAVYGGIKDTLEKVEYRDKLGLALRLDSFPSRKALFRHTRKWLKRNRRTRYLRRLFGRFSRGR